jgi:uncharacterized protein YyaL (SSP411 family)
VGGGGRFFKARVEDKPIFLSIGYSSCHWCHVMERESFENPAIADLLNQHFVSIKVDREERPDVDEIYISAVQLMAGHAGWPLSVFLTPDGYPFYGGTYYPPQVFAEVLARVAGVWQTGRGQVLAAAAELKAELEQLVAMRHQSLRGERSPSVFRAYKAQIVEGFDPLYGGFGGAPKFPPSTALPVLLTLGAEWEDTDSAGHGAHDADHDGAGRSLRPHRRGVPSLLDRRTLAAAPLREDALRQRAARLGVCARLRAHRRRVLRRHRRAHAGLDAARDAHP